MPKQVTFLPRVFPIRDIAAYHEDTDASLRLFFTSSNPNYNIRFFGKNHFEIDAELEKRLEDTDFRSSLAILSRLEAAFRLDYKQRCQKRKRDPVSKAFRKLYKEYKERVRLEEQILTTWKVAHPEKSQLISDLKGAFKFRHWLAHGTYWEPKLERKYDYQTIYFLAESVFTNFPLADPNPM